jgi:hypothetical protein
MPKPSLGRASQHEALFLRLTALHKDVGTLATRKGPRDTPDGVRIVAEGLLCECAPFRKTRDRLPVAAPDLAGLCVQLGQVLAQLADYERRYTFWDEALDCWCWRLEEGITPVKRLKPQIKAPPPQSRGPSPMREKLERMIIANRNSAYERGFEAGRVARMGPPLPKGFDDPDASARNNPRLADLE